MRSARILAVAPAAGQVVCAHFERTRDQRLILHAAGKAAGEPAAGPRGLFSISSWRRDFAAMLRAGRPRKQTYLALPGAACAVRRLSLPAVPPAQQMKLLSFEAQQLIEQPPEKLVWSHASIGGESRLVRTLLAAASQESVLSWTTGAGQSGLDFDAVEPGCLTVYRSFAYNHPECRDRVIALFDLGPRALRVFLIDPTGYSARQVNLSGGRVAAGTTPPFAVEKTVLAERAHLELARLVASMENGGTRSARIVVETVFVTGDPTETAELRECLATRLGLVVESYDPLKRVEVRGESLDPLLRSSLSELVGLALREPGRGPTLDLTPPDVGREREQRRRRPQWGLAALALVLVPLPPLAMYSLKAESTQARVEVMMADLRPLVANQTALNERLARQTELRATRDQLEVLLSSRGRWPALLDDLQTRLSEVDGVWFEELKLRLPEAAAETASVRLCGRVACDGGNQRANTPELRPAVESLMGRLHDSPFLAALVNERFDASEAGSLRFELTYKLAPGVLP